MMSYYWHQKTIPITSVVMLELALDKCGFNITETSDFMQSLIMARKGISSALSDDEKIVALEDLVTLIENLKSDDQLPKSIYINGYNFRLNGQFSYEVSGEDYGENDAEQIIMQLEEAYKSAPIELENELNNAIKTSSEISARKKIRLRNALIASANAQKKSYNDSIKEAKKTISQMIAEKANEEGYTIEKKKYNRGPNAGREKYVLWRYS